MVQHADIDHTGLPGISSGAVATDAIWDAAGDLVQGTGANTAAKLTIGSTGDVLGVSGGSAAWGSPIKGFPVAVLPVGCAIATAGAIGSIGTSATADLARAAPLVVPGAMRVRSMWININTAGSGSIEWGLFDLSTTLTGATKVAGGAAAPGGTAWREIAATGAPVAIKAGNYMLIVENPAANASTIGLYSAGAAPGFFKAWSTYTWDDTPDLTSGSWADSSLMWACYIEGDLDASNTRW